MSKNDTCKLRVMAWNIGFGSRKEGFFNDSVRAKAVLYVAKKLNVDVIALQEMANATYTVGLPSFDFAEYLKKNDSELNSIHFFPTTSLGVRHFYPYGKIRELNNKERICTLECGPGLWVRNVNGWYLRNLWSGKNIDRASVELQRPIPHPLYMGKSPASEGDEANKKYSAGRDEEDRPVLWSRIDNKDCKVKIFFLSLHLPTLKGEEQGKEISSLNQTQENIMKFFLSLSQNDLKKETKNQTNIVDILASKLRCRYLEQVVAQCDYIEDYWKDNRCVFILAGDFNFYHFNEKQLENKPEQVLLDEKHFQPVKTRGSSRSKGRLVDNIWVRGPVKVNECMDNDGVQIEAGEYYKLSYNNQWITISDHYPVIADIEL